MRTINAMLPPIEQVKQERPVVEMKAILTRCETVGQDVAGFLNRLLQSELDFSLQAEQNQAWCEEDQVSLPRLAGWWKNRSEKHKGKANTLIDYMNERGVPVLVMPSLSYMASAPQTYEGEKGAVVWRTIFDDYLERLKLHQASQLKFYELNASAMDPVTRKFIVQKMLETRAEDLFRISNLCAELLRCTRHPSDTTLPRVDQLSLTTKPSGFSLFIWEKYADFTD